MAKQDSYLGWKLDFTQPPGEPAYAEPDSVSWRVFKNPVTGAIGGACAVLLEFADPRIRTGVWEHSVYPVDPVGRAERTGYASAIGTYGPQSAARRVIAGITNMHSKVEGKTPNGRPYRALEPELLDWVSATAGYGFLTAYDRFAGPLSEEDKKRFWSEGYEVSGLYGVQRRAGSLEGFNEMMMELVPGFEPHQINFDFLDIMENAQAERDVPKFIRRYIARAAIDILPPIVREKLQLGKEYDLSPFGRMVVKLLARRADRMKDLNGPAAQSSERLGLPRDFLWRSQAAQKKLVGELRASGKLKPAKPIDASAPRAASQAAE